MRILVAILLTLLSGCGKDPAKEIAENPCLGLTHETSVEVFNMCYSEGYEATLNISTNMCCLYYKGTEVSCEKGGTCAKKIQ